MAIPLTVNGAVFEYPVDFDENWGVDATGWAQAMTVGTLQMAGGSFPLTANVNFGASFGLLSQFFSTRSANPSTVGTVRLSSADAGIGWRNNANSGNLILTTNASDQLLYNGFPIATSGGGAVTSIIGTANQIIASSPTGAVTLSTPQAIASTSSPTFANLTLTNPLPVTSGGTGQSSFGVGALSSNGTVLMSGTLAVSNGGTGTTTSTGTGNVVLSTSPTLVTPALGTPSVITLTNGTGLPIDAGTTGTLPVLRGGTGTTTSTGTGNVVLSNSPTLVTPALGTPSSATLTNATGLPIDVGTTGTLPVSRGGTGATSFTAYAVLAGGTTSTDPVQAVASVGLAGQVLTSNGAAALPTFQNTAGSGTVNSGTAGRVAYYAATGTTISDTTAFTVGANGPNGILVGTNTNNSAATGYVGEYVEAVVAAVAFPATTAFGDAASISLTAGDWDVSANVLFSGGTTNVSWYTGISTTSGNSSAGLVLGSNYAAALTAPTATNAWAPIAAYRISLTATTTIYLKYRADYTGSVPTLYGRLSARRMR